MLIWPSMKCNIAGDIPCFSSVGFRILETLETNFAFQLQKYYFFNKSDYIHVDILGNRIYV